jgi:uncharacterized protein YktA (UPF0223 family)
MKESLPKQLEASTRISLSVLHFINTIKDLPTKEQNKLAAKFKDFKIS